MGSNHYKAPEMGNKRPYSFGIDVFSLGVTTYYMLKGDWKNAVDTFSLNTSSNALDFIQ